MATAGAVPKEKRLPVDDRAAGNDIDATVDYNDYNKTKRRADRNASVAPHGNDAAQKRMRRAHVRVPKFQMIQKMRISGAC